MNSKIKNILLKYKFISSILIIIVLISLLITSFIKISKFKTQIDEDSTFEKIVTTDYVKIKYLKTSLIDVLLSSNYYNTDGILFTPELKVEYALEYASEDLNTDTISLDKLKYYFNYLFNENIDEMNIDFNIINFSNFKFNIMESNFVKSNNHDNNIKSYSLFSNLNLLSNYKIFTTDFEKIIKDTDTNNVFYTMSADIVTLDSNDINLRDKVSFYNLDINSNEITLDSLTQDNYNILGTKVASLNITITRYQNRIVIKDITIIPNK